jgi:hypothetical protein
MFEVIRASFLGAYLQRENCDGRSKSAPRCFTPHCQVGYIC